MSEQRSAIVIGAGVVGMATAYALARRGWRVRLVDQAMGPAMGASHSNGAQLSYCYADALASPAVLANSLSILFKDDGLSITPSLSPAFAAWLAAFARNCTSARFKQNTLAALALAQESRAAMDALLAKHPISFGHRKSGKMHLYFAPAAFEDAKRVLDLKSRHGCEQSVLSPDDIPAIDPALKSIAGSLAGAIYTPSEEVGDPHRFCRGLLTVLKTHYDVQTTFGSAVKCLDIAGDTARLHLQSGEDYEAGLAVICAGQGSNALLRPLGLSLPIQPMKGYSFEMPLTEGSPKVSVTDTARRIVFTNLGDRMRVAGFADLGNRDPAVDPLVAARLVAAARASLPDAGDYDLADKHWAGLRPMTPNSMPIMSRPKRALAINAGHGMLGWTLAMGSAEYWIRLMDPMQMTS
ncbi:FAD-dependent oxidoreductase [Pontixanthobacter aquaemixtae]|uniref:FAD-dependent oxidoreductase n=1 Tax=Pontixanthobacter aquaemixtae TaxID=1958940 RepID=A0A844ZPS8_9SPHN|nr:FAD-dependent oxidoreductase [Pontixanthobacter aquaemixtae]MXO89352.1 FAD-dependent oxidoreductase [Pontixanthobacter aquaemixtae]